jgi:hypothetical protein
MHNRQRPQIATTMGKFRACRTLPTGDHIPPIPENSPSLSVLRKSFSSYENFFLESMDEDGEAAAEDEVVAEPNDEVEVETTEEE